eukprot:g5266.t1
MDRVLSSHLSDGGVLSECLLYSGDDTEDEEDAGKNVKEEVEEVVVDELVENAIVDPSGRSTATLSGNVADCRPRGLHTRNETALETVEGTFVHSSREIDTRDEDRASFVVVSAVSTSASVFKCGIVADDCAVEGLATPRAASNDVTPRTASSSARTVVVHGDCPLDMSAEPMEMVDALSPEEPVDDRTLSNTAYGSPNRLRGASIFDEIETNENADVVLEARLLHSKEENDPEAFGAIPVDLRRRFEAALLDSARARPGNPP